MENFQDYDHLISTDTCRYIKSACKDDGTFSVLSYNTLADIYAPYQTFCPPEFLHFNYRKIRIACQLKLINSDFICLQEVDKYEEFFKPLLESLNYSSNYIKRPANRNPDGSVLAWKSDTWEIIKTKTLSYNDMETCLSKSIYRRNNVGIIGVFRNKTSGKLLIVGNSHFYWDPEVEYIKFAQGLEFSFEAFKLKTKHNCPAILVGDFNSEPETYTMKYMLGKELDLSYSNFLESEILAIFKPNPMKFSNAYSNYLDGRYPEFSNYTQDYKGFIDHILYTDEIEVKEIGKLPSFEDFEDVVGIPNADHPSDHLPLVASFYFK